MLREQPKSEGEGASNEKKNQGRDQTNGHREYENGKHHHL